MKRLLLCALLFCAFTASAQDYLKTFRNKTSQQIANVTHLQRRDTTFYHIRIGDYDRDLAAAIEARGLTPLDFATIKAALDTSIFRQNRLIFPPGTFTVDSLGIYSPITLSGVGIKRIKPVDSTYYGSIIQSTDNTGLDLIKIYQSGVYLHDVTLLGTGSDGHGVLSSRQAVGGSIRTTLGGYGLSNVNSSLHGGDGFHFRGGDGLFLPGLEAFGNRGYGITFIGPGADGQATAGATADGTTNILLSGRTRSNSKGGIQINNNAASLLMGSQSVHDTTWNVYVEGKNRQTIINGDYEFAIPPLDTSIHSYMNPHVLEPVVANMYLNKTRSLTMIGTFLGSDNTEATYTADDLADSSYTTGSGTDSTHIVSSQLLANVDGYYKEWEVKNTTLGGSFVAVTAFDAALNKLTLASSIVGQTSGQSFTIRRTPDYGMLVDSLESAVLINNALCSNCDAGKKIGVTSYANAIFLGANQNFNVLTDIDAINGATVNAVGIQLDRITTGGDFQIYGTPKYDFYTQDSFLVRSGSGMRQQANGVYDMQYSSLGNVRTFFDVEDGLSKEYRIYGDANTGVGLNKKYFAFGWNTSTDNQFDIKNETGVDSVYINFNNVVKFGGSTTAERYTAYLNRAAGTKPTAKNGEVQTYSRGDTLYAQDKNGVERSLYAAAGASGDITDVIAGDGLSGGGTSGSVTLKFNPKLTSQTLEITSDSVRVKAASIGANELSSTTVVAGSYTTASVTFDEDGRATNASSVTTLTGLDATFTDLDLTGASAGNTIVRRASGVWVDSTLSGSGDVVGPASSTDEAVARFDGTTGKLLQNTSALTLSDAGAFSFADGVKQTFNPDGTNSGINVGSQAGNPSASASGDLWLNSTTGRLMAKDGEGYNFPVLFDPSLVYRKYEDWDAGATSTSGAMGVDWVRTIATSGSTTKEPGESGAPGIMRLFCANSAGSVAALHTDTDVYILNGPYTAKARIRLSTLGTATTNGAYYRVGYMDDVGATIPTDGAWIEFNVDSSATRWRAITGNGGTRTITTYTGSTVSATTWYKLEIVPNSAGTSFVFKVDGTTIATHTTNLPSGAVGFALVAAAVTASSTKFMSNDYVLIQNLQMSR